MSDCLKQKKKDSSQDEEKSRNLIQDVGSAAIEILQLLSLGRISDYHNALKTENGTTTLAVVAYADMIEASKNAITDALIMEQQTVSTLTTQLKSLLAEIDNIDPTFYQQSRYAANLKSVFMRDINKISEEGVRNAKGIIDQTQRRQVIIQADQSSQQKKNVPNIINSTSESRSTTFSRDVKSYSKLADVMKQAQTSQSEVGRSINTADGVFDIVVKPRRKR